MPRPPHQQPHAGSLAAENLAAASPTWAGGPEPALTAGPFTTGTPAFTTGTAAEMLGVTQAFLRQLGAAGLLDPHRSDGGHRRYSSHELDLAGRARQLVDEGLSLDAACRIVTLETHVAALEADLADARAQLNQQHEQRRQRRR